MDYVDNLRLRLSMLEHRLDPAYFRGLMDAIRVFDSNDNDDDDALLFRAVHPDNLRAGRRIVLDHDDVVFDFVGGLLKTINEARGTSWTYNDVPNWSFKPNIFQSEDEFDEWMRSHPEILERQEPFEDGVEFAKEIRRLAEEFDVPFLYYTSAHQATDYVVKTATVVRYLGPDWQHLLSAGAGDKSNVYRPGDVVLDDSPMNLERARRIGAFPVAIARPWNSPTSEPGWKGSRYDHKGALERVRAILRGFV